MEKNKKITVNASGFKQKNVRGSAFNTGKDEKSRPKQTVVVTK